MTENNTYMWLAMTFVALLVAGWCVAGEALLNYLGM